MGHVMEKMTAAHDTRLNGVTNKVTDKVHGKFDIHSDLAYPIYAHEKSNGQIFIIFCT